jgi:cell division initiation protein
MGMTPADVEQKTFSTALRGYDLDEVDDFLDEVVSTIRELQDQIVGAKAEPPAAPPGPAPDESAIGRALVTAQTTADTMIADAQKEADQIRTAAETEADSWADERDAKKAAADEEMVELTSHVSGVRTQLAVLATAVADRLDEMDEAIGKDPGADVEIESPEDEAVAADRPQDDVSSGEDSDGNDSDEETDYSLDDESSEDDTDE